MSESTTTYELLFINTGSYANSGDADTLRTAFNKLNYNSGIIEYALNNIVMGVTTMTSSLIVTGGYESTSTESGSLIVIGGVGITGSLNVTSSSFVDVVFSDGSLQNTAYPGYAVAVTTSTNPYTSVSSLWYNSLEGQLYLNYNGSWVSATPVQPTPTPYQISNNGYDLTINSSGTVYFPDSTSIYSNYGSGYIFTIDAFKGINLIGQEIEVNTTEGFYSNGSIVVTTASLYELILPYINSGTSTVTNNVSGGFANAILYQISTSTTGFVSTSNLHVGYSTNLVGGSATFSDGSIQTTAYLGYATTLSTSTAPTTVVNAFWYNDLDGQLYLNYNNSWVPANPQIPTPTPNQISNNGYNLTISNSGTILLPDTTEIYSNYSSGYNFTIDAFKGINLIGSVVTVTNTGGFYSNGSIVITTASLYQYVTPYISTGSVYSTENLVGGFTGAIVHQTSTSTTGFISTSSLQVGYANNLTGGTVSATSGTFSGVVNIKNELLFNDSSTQITAYLGYATTISTSTSPTTVNDAFWYDDVDGQLYLNYNGSWVSASPQVPNPTPSQIVNNGYTLSISTSGIVTLPDTTTIYSNYSSGYNFTIDAFKGITLIGTGTTITSNSKSWSFLSNGLTSMPLVTGTPTNVTTGSMAVCDGINWNPENDGLEHLLIYINGSWTKIV